MSLHDGVIALRKRVKNLDDARNSEDLPPWIQHSHRSPVVRDAEKFICVLDEVPNPGHSSGPIVTPAVADSIIDESRLIRRIRSGEPELVSGGVPRSRQYWVSTGKPPWVPARVTELSPKHFVSAGTKATRVSTNPFGVGLYTSTGFQGTQGMWRLFLDQGKYSSNFPGPWHIWRIHCNETARVFEVTAATQWQELVLSFPVVHEHLIYPDWQKLAVHFDAVHMTLSGIAAIQGMRLETPDGLIASTVWDVESTFWLNWSFDSVSPMETVHSVPT